jgi:hypothetical protein
MQSLWEYLRFRTRDSMLAGMQDALDQAEGNGNPDSHQEAAGRFLEQRAANPPLAVSRTPQEAPRPVDARPTGNGPTTQSPLREARPAASPQARPSGPTVAPAAEQPRPRLVPERTTASPADDRVFDEMRAQTQPLDPFEARLQETHPDIAESNFGPARPDPNQEPRKRGRPRKNP